MARGIRVRTILDSSKNGRPVAARGKKWNSAGIFVPAPMRAITSNSTGLSFIVDAGIATRIVPSDG